MALHVVDYFTHSSNFMVRSKLAEFLEMVFDCREFNSGTQTHTKYRVMLAKAQYVLSLIADIPVTPAIGCLWLPFVCTKGISSRVALHVVDYFAPSSNS